MNNAWLIFCLVLASALFSGGWETRGWYDGVATSRLTEVQETNTINAENTVIATVKKQGNITQGTENAYHTQINLVDDLYNTSSLFTSNTASNGVPSISVPSNGSSTISCKPSKKFKLTAKQCDETAERLIALQSWIKQQQAIK